MLSNALVFLITFVGTTRALGDATILRGFPPGALQVTIEPLDPDGRKAGLTEAGLKKVIETRVTKRQIPTAATANGEIYGRIVVLTSRSTANEVLGYGAHVELSFRERAVLKRDKTVEFAAPIWFKGAVAVANPKTIVAEVVHQLANLTDEFLNDFQHQNPRP